MVDDRFFQLKKKVVTVGELAQVVGARLGDDKDATRMVKGVAPVDKATREDITFISNTKYVGLLAASEAGACIIEEKYKEKAPASMALIIAEDAYVTYARIAHYLYPEIEKTPGISSVASIDPTAVLGKGCCVEPYAVIGKNVEVGEGTYIASGVVVGDGVTIGKRCRILSSATLTHSRVGDNVIIHSGVRIGQDGFGFAFDRGTFLKVPQLGCVVIGNNVEIGANSCIDRGANGDTIIGDGTKIDNLVQIGHNVKIGKHCIVVAQVGISGSTEIGNYVMLGGQAGVAGHLKIGDGVKVAAKSGVIKDVSPKITVGGYPAIPVQEWHRQSAILKKLTKNKHTGKKKGDGAHAG